MGLLRGWRGRGQRDERGRRTATANTAGAVMSSVVETSEGPER
ncbi:MULTISPECIES: hypothetical protein [Streptomyces]